MAAGPAPAATFRSPSPHGVAPRPRIALISPWRPLPVDNGSKQRIRNLIEALAPDYDLALISLLPDEEISGGLRGHIPGVAQEWALPLPSYDGRSARGLVDAFGPRPRSFAATWHRRMARQVAGRVREFGADLALGTDLRILRYLCWGDPRLPRVLDEANVSAFLTYPDPAAGVARKLRERARERKYRWLLSEAARRLDAVIVSSVHEASAYAALTDGTRPTIIENAVAGVPVERWRAGGSRQLLFTGALGYSANADAVRYFQAEIWEHVLAAEPAAELVVTGAVPNPLPKGLVTNRLTLTGRLASLDATMRSAGVFVVPLREGIGTRIKILEALAYGMPVVSTSKGAEGLAVRHGEHLLIADDPRDFARATVRLLRDTALAEVLGARGRELVQERYTWARQGEVLRTLVRDVLAGATVRA